MTDEDQKALVMGGMLKAMSEAVREEMPEAGYIFILGTASDDAEEGNLVSVSNLDTETLIHMLTLTIERRKQAAAQTAGVKPPTTLQ
jgi:hypothetical protein